MLLSPRDPNFPHSAILHAIVRFSSFLATDLTSRSVRLRPVGLPRPSSPAQMALVAIILQNIMRVKLANT